MTPRTTLDGRGGSIGGVHHAAAIGSRGIGCTRRRHSPAPRAAKEPSNTTTTAAAATTTTTQTLGGRTRTTINYYDDGGGGPACHYAERFIYVFMWYYIIIYHLCVYAFHTVGGGGGQGKEFTARTAARRSGDFHLRGGGLRGRAAIHTDDGVVYCNDEDAAVQNNVTRKRTKLNMAFTSIRWYTSMCIF